jgi:hypothetical protein
MQKRQDLFPDIRPEVPCIRSVRFLQFQCQQQPELPKLDIMHAYLYLYSIVTKAATSFTSDVYRLNFDSYILKPHALIMR